MRIKRAVMAILIASATTISQAQTTPPISASNHVVVKYSWVKESIVLENDAFRVPVETFNQTTNRVANERRQSPVRQAAANAEKEDQKRSSEPPRYAFRYRLFLHNQAEKGIKEIDWDYIFTDEKTGEELGRREFTSVEKIGANKRKELVVRVTTPPTRSISAHTLGKNERAGLVEKVEVRRILYDDGSVWVSS